MRSMSRFGKMLAMLAAAIGACLVVGARAADWQLPGIYAYETKDWNADVEKQFPRIVIRYYMSGGMAHQVATIRDLAQRGNRVIIDFEFMRNYAQRKGTEAMPPYQPVETELLSLLEKLDGVPVEAITLDEENSLTADKIAYLNRLYAAAKKEFPKRRFLQWIMLRKKAGQVDFDLVGSIAAAGWIIDPYLSSQKDYGNIIRGLKATSKPVYSVIWATPGKDIQTRELVGAKAEWWNNSQWKFFYNRLAINQANKVPTIFYLYGIEGRTIKRTWAGSACDKKFYADLVRITLPYYRSNKLSPVTPASRPSWIPAYCEGKK